MDLSFLAHLLLAAHSINIYELQLAGRNASGAKTASQLSPRAWYGGGVVSRGDSGKRAEKRQAEKKTAPLKPFCHFAVCLPSVAHSGISSSLIAAI